MSENKKDLEVVSGDGSNLNISHAHNYLNAAKPKNKEKINNIVIPKPTSKKDDDDEDDDNEE